MNPQVAFGLQLVGDGWTSASWIYYVACPLGGAIGALVYDRVFLRPRELPPEEPIVGSEAIAESSTEA
jgi:hypothetical protein